MDYRKMIAAAGALVCAAAVADGLTSDNIVGYTTTPLVTGNKLVAIPFLPIGDAEGYSIQDIIPAGADLDNVQMQTLTKAGKGDETFAWDTWEYVAPGEEAWADDKGVATRKFKPGEALWVQGVDNYTLTTKGEVGKADVIINLVTGNVACGNPFPVEISIQDIVPTGANLDNIQIQTLTKAGKGDETFAWDTWEYVAPGEEAWADDKGVATRKFQPGEGLWVQGVEGYTLRIPAPTF